MQPFMPQSMAAANGGHERGRILYVDGASTLRNAISVVLEGRGYDMRCADCGCDAIAAVREGFNPDVLIAGFHLDHAMNGAEVAEKLRTVLRYATPVIILTLDLYNANFPCIRDSPVWLAPKSTNSILLLLAALPSLIDLSRATRSLTS